MERRGRKRILTAYNWRETCRKGLPPPYGWRYSADAGGLVEVKEEQRVRRRILVMHTEGQSMRAIAAYLEEKGYPPPPQSAQWYHSHVQKILLVERRRLRLKWRKNYQKARPGVSATPKP